MRRALAGSCLLFCSMVVVASPREVTPARVLLPSVAPGAERGQFSERSLVVGLEVDRDGATIVAYTVKARPFVASLARPTARVVAAGGPVQLEVVLLGPSDGRYTQRVEVRGLCLEHGPDAEPHTEGDAFRLHRDAVLVTLPEIPGFDRIEAAYYTGDGSPVRHSLGERSLDTARLVPQGAPREYQQLQPETPSPPPAGQSSTVIWPEDLNDANLYQVYGDEAELAKRIDVVIVPDGYRYAEKALMQTHAQQLVNALRAKTPYKEHDRFFNYTLVYAYSVDSGTDQCDCSAPECGCDPIVDTAMGTYFPDDGPCGTERLLNHGIGPHVCDTNGIPNIVSAELRAPDHDYTVLMVNTNRRGGGGGTRASYSAGHPDGLDIAGHEIAHVIAGLADEYGGERECGTVASEINTSLDEDEGAWLEWIADIGHPPIEGAQRYEECIYRPEDECAMRREGRPFCRVCNQQWALRIFGHEDVAPTAPVETVSPGTCLRVNPGTTVPFSVGTRFAAGVGVTNTIAWKLNGTQVASGTANHSQLFKKPGNYVLTSTVTADTNFIRVDKSNLYPNQDVITWEITAATSLPVDCNGNGLPDDCEQDCNNNGQPDDCEGLPDCDSDRLPDTCEPDCNANGVPDDCDGLPDCDGNGVPDVCQLPGSTCSDGLYCNGVEVCGLGGCAPGVPPCPAEDVCSELDDTCMPRCPEVTCCAGDPGDACAPAEPSRCTTLNTNLPECAVDENTLLKCQPGTVIVENCSCTGGGSCPGQNQTYYCSEGTPGGAPDCDIDGLPDLCEEDCDGNGSPDQCETSPDCDHDGLRDACEVDCNENGTPDDCEQLPDCDQDGIPNTCEADCNENGTPDDCEQLPDCDDDGVLDECETDCNDNGTPDDCESGAICPSGQVCSPVLDACVAPCPPSYGCGPEGVCWAAFPPDCIYGNTGLNQCSADPFGLDIYSCDSGDTVRWARCNCSGLPGALCLNHRRYYYCD